MITIFQAEIDAGLAEAVRDQTSVAYLSPVLSASPPVDLSGRIAVAALTDPVDDPLLLYFEDILATSGWNLNLDVLSKEELWASRHTIDDKPINLGHVYKDIVGHVVGSQAVDAQYNPIPEDTAVADLPDVFHVKNQSVIYRRINDPVRDAYIGDLEQEIREGKWFVSMEAFFNDFDYALWDKADGRKWIRKRNESTAFLTKHMRQYGGDGTYTTADGRKLTIGRRLNDVRYKGKGVVARPGNPDSIIFAETHAFQADYDEPPITPGYSTPSTPPSTDNEETLMPEIDNALDAAKAEIVDLKRQLQEAVDAKLGQRITELEQTVAGLNEDVTAAKNETVQVQVIADTFETTLVKTQEDLESAQAELASARADLAVFKTAQTKAARLDAVKTAGQTDASVAADLVDSLAVLDDEAFQSTVAVLAKTWTARPETPAVTPEDEQNAIAAAVENSTEAALIVEQPAAPDRKAVVASIKSDLCNFSTGAFRR